jgi:hypothetical protein
MFTSWLILWIVYRQLYASIKGCDTAASENLIVLLAENTQINHEEYTKLHEAWMSSTGQGTVTKSSTKKQPNRKHSREWWRLKLSWEPWHQGYVHQVFNHCQRGAQDFGSKDGTRVYDSSHKHDINHIHYHGIQLHSWLINNIRLIRDRTRMLGKTYNGFSDRMKYIEKQHTLGILCSLFLSACSPKVLHQFRWLLYTSQALVRWYGYRCTLSWEASQTLAHELSRAGKILSFIPWIISGSTRKISRLFSVLRIFRVPVVVKSCESALSFHSSQTSWFCFLF